MSNRTRLLIAAICVLYVAVRLWRLTDSCLWFDEIFSVHAAEHPWGLIFWFVAQDLIHPPLFYVLLKGWITLGGESVMWLRMFPLVFSVAALVPFIYLCRELKLRTSATILALALFAVNGALIKYAQEVRMYAPLLCLSLFSIWLFARFYFRGKNIWILTIVNVLLVYTHYFGWFVIGSELAMIFVFQRVKIRHVLTMSGIAIVAFVPWMIAVVRAASAGSDVHQNIGWMTRPGIRQMFQFVFDALEPFYFQQSSGEASTILYVTIPLLIVIVVAKVMFLVDWKRAENKSAIYLMSAFVIVPLVLAFAVSWIAPVSIWGSRHLIIVFAPVTIMIAVLVTSIESKIARHIAIGLISLLIVVAGVRAALTPSPQYVWCGWEKLGSKAALAEQPVGEPRRIYAFEDLIAYHLWFAMRESPNTQVSLMTGVEGVRNDPSYFLPRGFDGVNRTEFPNVEGETFWIAFRREGRFDAKPDGLKPLSNFEQLGYEPDQYDLVIIGSETCFLVRLKRTDAH